MTGGFGVILLLFNIFKVMENRELLFTYILGLALFAGVALAGYALYADSKNSLKYSIWAQALQVLGITYGSGQYLFTGSAFLSLVIHGGVRFHAQLEPVAYSISDSAYPMPLEIKIFLVPIILIILLLIKKL